MKIAGKWIGLALLILTMVSVNALAQNGEMKGYGGNEISGHHGNGDNADEGGFANGKCQNIRSRFRTQILSSAEPILLIGIVAEATYAGAGLILDTSDADGLLTTVYGIGPQWYWDLLGVSKPDVGEELEIEALKITLSDGSVRIIATSITILGDGGEVEDIVIPLRDEDGRPMWRQVGYGLD